MPAFFLILHIKAAFKQAYKDVIHTERGRLMPSPFAFRAVF